MAKRSITPEDLLRVVLAGDAQISPDGARILFTRKHIGEKNKPQTNLWTVDRKGSVRQWTQGKKDGTGRWCPDGSQIAFVSGREAGGAQVHLIRADGGDARKLTNLPEGTIRWLAWSPDGSRLAIEFREQQPEWTEKAKKEREEKGLSTPAREIDNQWYRFDGDGYFLGQRFQLLVIDPVTGAHKSIFQGGRLDFFDCDWSPDSKELVVSCPQGENPLAQIYMDFQLLRIDLKGNQQPIEVNLKGVKSNLRWSPDGKWLAFAGQRDADWGCNNTQLFVCPAAGGEARSLTAATDFCVEAGMLSDMKDAGSGTSFLWSPDSATITLQVGWHGAQNLARIDVATADLQFLTDTQTAISLGNASRNGSALAVVTSDATHLPEIGVFDVTSGKLEGLTRLNAGLMKELHVAEPAEFWTEAADGWKVHGWIMRPAGSGPHAAVLQVHGGPHAQYGWAFFHEFQVLAAAGYAVVYANPRGSKGYGEAHCTAIKGKWGDKDWLDIQAVLKWMQTQPEIDASNIGIMGGSYGGYMTNWAVGHTKAFKAAITDRCVSNLVSQNMTSDFPFQPDSYWPGLPWSSLENIAELWRQSPIAYFDQVETPMLIIHSEGDLRCNVAQSEQVFTALQQRGIESRFIRYPQSTFHGMSRSGPPDLRIHRLHEILKWWKKHLANRT